mgnify:CR=1 FL=1
MNELINLILSRRSCRGFSRKTVSEENVKTIKEIVELDYDLKILCTVNELSRTIKNVLQKGKKYLLHIQYIIFVRIMQKINLFFKNV